MSGLVFGLFHLNINQFCYAFVIGVVFAFLVEATGSIWSSVLAHFAINTYSITIIQLLKITGTYDTMQEAAEFVNFYVTDTCYASWSIDWIYVACVSVH